MKVTPEGIEDIVQQLTALKLDSGGSAPPPPPLPPDRSDGNGGGMEQRVTKLEDKLDKVSERLGEVRERLVAVETKIDHLPGKGFVVTVTIAALTMLSLITAIIANLDRLVH